MSDALPWVLVALLWLGIGFWMYRDRRRRRSGEQRPDPGFRIPGAIPGARIESREEWERVRARGHGRWIVRTGLIGFALPLEVLLLAYLYVDAHLSGSGPSTPWWVIVLTTILLGAAGGYLFADSLWHRYEERFGDGPRR